MSYNVKFAIQCEVGKSRSINQDNFWHDGQFLHSSITGLSSPVKGNTSIQSCSIFAIFDGLGGEKYGEMAAYIAAKTLDGFISEINKMEQKNILSTACIKMNDEICSYAASNQINRMGTTAVLLAFGKKKIHLCNVGDSKTFLFDTKLTQISVDHVVALPGNRKPPLSQYLGIPSNEFIIEPYVAEGRYKDEDRYLLCTDGLTDMVSHDEIEAIMSTAKPVEETANILMETALANGGRDNITIILCEITKKPFFGKNFFKRKEEINEYQQNGTVLA